MYNYHFKGDFISDKPWYNNPDSVKKLISNFEKAGLPLEYRAKKIFEKYKFEADEYYYQYPYSQVAMFDDFPDTKWKQIDIFAYNEGVNTQYYANVGNTKFHLDFSFAGECKFSSDKAFFLLPSKSTYLSNFPLSNIGKYFLPEHLNTVELHAEDRENYPNICDFFNMPLYEQIVEVDVEHMDRKNDNNYNDGTIFRACNQLFNATNYSKLTYLDDCDDFREDIIYTPLFEKWINYIHENNLQKEEIFIGKWVNRKITYDFLKNHFDISDIDSLNNYFVSYCFPIIIIDTSKSKNSKLFKIVFDDNHNINSFEPIKYGIYSYTHNLNLKTLESTIYPESMEVIICDINYLDECIEKIIMGMKSLSIFLEELFSRKPYLAAYDILFNHYLLNPDLFFR